MFDIIDARCNYEIQDVYWIIVVTECVCSAVRAESLISLTVLLFFFKCHGSSNYSPAYHPARPSSILVKSI